MSQAASPARIPILPMAIGVGVAAANVFYSQPLVELIARDFKTESAALVPTAAQLGYAAGLFLIVPLGDLFERRRLTVMGFVALAVVAGAMAAAPNLVTLMAAAVLVGLFSTVSQQIIPFAAQLAAPERRGAVMGKVMSGLLCGVLLSRTLSGFIGAHLGWRAALGLTAPLPAIAAVLMQLLLPKSQPTTTLSYGGLLHSLGGMWRELPTLRTSAFTQASLVAGFNVFWTLLAFRLAEPPFNLGADVAGAFGVIGAAGILAAPLAGSLADRIGPRRIIMTAIGLYLFAWLILAGWNALAGLAAGVILLDLAVQTALVSNQHIVYVLRPEARSRLSTLFVGTMFIGSTLGSGVAVLAWRHGGWETACACGAGFALLAGLIQLMAGRRAKAAAAVD